ncbi:MAG: tetratricopeptide repeat protein [Spirochaetia bacterium]
MLIILLISCGTVQEQSADTDTSNGRLENTETEEITSQINQDNTVIPDARSSIASATPDSLYSAAQAIINSDLRNTPEARALLYAADQTLEILYPGADQIDTSVTPPGDYYFSQMFENIEAGEAFAAEGSSAGFISLVFPALALLNTSDIEIEEAFIEMLQNALTLNQESVLPPFLLGLIHHRRGEENRALEYYNLTLSIDPDMYPAKTGRAFIYFSNNRTVEAFQAADELFQEYSEDPYVIALAARQYYERTEYNSARNYINRALQLAPQNMQFLILKGLILEAMNDWTGMDQLLSVLERYPRKGPEYYRIHAMYALEYREDEQTALEKILTGLEEYPNNMSLYLPAAQIFHSLGQFTNAVNHYTLILDVPAYRKQALTGLTEIALMRNNFSQARSYIDELLEIEETESLLLTAAEIYAQLGLESELADIYNKLYTNYGVNYLPEYIQLLLATNQRAQALSLINSRIDTLEDSAIRSQLYYYLAVLTEERQEKISILRTALYEDPTNTDALIQMGRAYERNQELQRALLYYRQAFILEPENQELSDRITEIESQM